MGSLPAFRSPSTKCKSVRHTPHACTRMSTSSPVGSGTLRWASMSGVPRALSTMTFIRACRNSATPGDSASAPVVVVLESDADHLEHNARSEQYRACGGAHAERACRREPHEKRAGYDENDTDAAPQLSSPQHKRP